MASGYLHFILVYFFTYSFSILYVNSENIAKLPFCSDNIKHTELILVSTLDGILTALSPSGVPLWNVETGPGPLLSSSIHQLELTNNGQWIRLIPSLSGGLYKFDGITIDAIPISADSLLKSSFRYSDDLVIAGGKEVRTYGVLINSGRNLYQCSWEGCNNTTDDADDLEDIIIIERKTHTVRAVEPRTGFERWNFSVGQHNIKIPYTNCISSNVKSVNLNITAILPEGLVIATKTNKHTEKLWQHKFEAPIVAIWKWNGRDLNSLNLFNSRIANSIAENAPSIYVGMHDNQLYVHESSVMRNILQLKQDQNDKVPIADYGSLTQIPWKPIPAANMLVNNDDGFEDSTALSVLYASEYVNGNGYYLYTVDNEKFICESNTTNAAAFIETPHFHVTLLYWWKEAVIILITCIIIFNCVHNFQLFTLVSTSNAKEQLPIASTQYHNFQTVYPDTVEISFNSRYMAEFDPISCLGMGGFGVVFEAKKKFDECNYAIKRITLPNRPEAKDRMMREVKALAKLDHRNIVRYYNAWLECPPVDWQYQHDQQWLRDCSAYIGTSESLSKLNSKIDSSTHTINLENCTYQNTSSESSSIIFQQIKDADESSFIVFENSQDASNHIATVNTDTNPTTQSRINSKDCVNKNKVSFNQYYPTSSPPVYLYIQMQLCCKESLKDWLIVNNARDRIVVLSIFEQIVEAVEYVHFTGLIHRDLKPSNIFFALDGQIKVGDFGLVTSIKDYSDTNDEMSPELLQRNYTNAVGTDLYMSPEQLTNQQYDHKVDIYSLGIILFELLVSFNTEMERLSVLKDLRNAVYPNDFASKFQKEYELLKCMLSNDPKNRPSALGVCERLRELDETHGYDSAQNN